MLSQACASMHTTRQLWRRLVPVIEYIMRVLIISYWRGHIWCTCIWCRPDGLLAAGLLRNCWASKHARLQSLAVKPGLSLMLHLEKATTACWLLTVCNTAALCSVTAGQPHQVTVYTFGAPRVGNAAFAAAFNDTVEDSWRVTNCNDIIPTVPRLMGYCHVRHGARLQPDGVLQIQNDSRGAGGNSIPTAYFAHGRIFGHRS